MFANSGGCPPGYQMGIPLTVDTDWKHFDNCSDDICGGGGCEFEDTDPDEIHKPCCANGCCKHCAVIGGDAPYLVPKSLACGRHRMIDEPISGLLSNMDSMPGRGDHSLLCVRARGVNQVSITGTPGDQCEGHDLFVQMDIPIEMVLKDCCGFIYTIKGTIPEMKMKIPLGFKAKHVSDGGAFLYLKVKVRLCQQMDGVDTGSTVTLNILMEGCVMRMVPYGIVGDPTSRFGPYFCS